MKILLHQQNKNFENIEYRKCTMNVLYARHYIYINLLEDLKNEFVFICCIDNSDNSFTQTFFEKRFNISLNKLRKMCIMYTPTESTFISQNFYNDKIKNAVNELLFTPSIQSEDVVKTDYISTLNLQHIYAVEQGQWKTFEPTSNFKQVHFFSLLLQSTQERIGQIYPIETSFVRIFILHNVVALTVYTNNKFNSIHQFNYETTEDAVYRIVHTLNVLEIFSENLNLFLNYITHIDVSVKFEDLLTLYFNHIERENRPVVFKYPDDSLKNNIFLLAPFFEVSL